MLKALILIHYIKFWTQDRDELERGVFMVWRKRMVRGEMGEWLRQFILICNFYIYLVYTYLLRIFYRATIYD